ncbi:hypothetical protein V1511DRAFT_134837 [Dipodascopsis uninucleata]
METPENGFIPGSGIVHSEIVDVSKSIADKRIDNYTIVITGGASGLGAGFAREWSKRGANVIIGDVKRAEGEALIAEIRQATENENHHFLELDVTDWGSQVTFFREAAKLSPHGEIDCIVANAGITSTEENAAFMRPPDYTQMDGIPPKPSLKIMDVNLTGELYTAHLAMAYLSKNRGNTPRDRHLILMSSAAGICPLTALPLYTTSKHGVAGLFRALRATGMTYHGVRVNMLNPYFCKTPLLAKRSEILMAGIAFAELDDVIEAATRLVVDKSIIGRALAVGPRASRDVVEQVGLSFTSGNSEQSIWDVYSGDFDQTDIFTRRFIAITNIVAATKGWIGFFKDIASALRR